MVINNASMGKIVTVVSLYGTYATHGRVWEIDTLILWRLKATGEKMSEPYCPEKHLMRIDEPGLQQQIEREKHNVKDKPKETKVKAPTKTESTGI